MVWVNDFGYSFTTGQASWGGVKSSGFGRTSSKHGLYECVQVKYLDSDRGRLRPAWWFPYDAETERALRAALDVLYGTGLERWRAAWRSRRELRHLLRRSRMSELSHVDESGAVRMVDVGDKPMSRRRAVASAQVQMSPETSRRLRDLPKGDALATAQLAGIMAAKRTSELIPLCHPLPLSHIEVTLDVQDGVVGIVAVAETTAQTGVEMEALTAASVAALTLYDMCKAVDKAMTISELRLIEKTKEEV